MRALACLRGRFFADAFADAVRGALASRTREARRAQKWPHTLPVSHPASHLELSPTEAAGAYIMGYRKRHTGARACDTPPQAFACFLQSRQSTCPAQPVSRSTRWRGTG